MSQSTKKFGGTIRNWQTHTLSIPIEKARLHLPIREESVMKFSGTVVDDPLGRWAPGFHMISSIIVEINREAGTIETANTIYNVVDEGGDVFQYDIGDSINQVFY